MQWASPICPCIYSYHRRTLLFFVLIRMLVWVSLTLFGSQAQRMTERVFTFEGTAGSMRRGRIDHTGMHQITSLFDSLPSKIDLRIALFSFFLSKRFPRFHAEIYFRRKIRRTRAAEARDEKCPNRRGASHLLECSATFPSVSFPRATPLSRYASDISAM